jgi:hypothetical protein
MRIAGTLDMPQTNGRYLQVIIRFYLNDGNGGKGTPVGSLSPVFAMPDGSAACGTPKLPVLSGKGLNWFGSMPYGALNLPRGNGFPPYRRSELVAEPVLYLDDFAIAKGPVIPFFVNL